PGAVVLDPFVGVGSTLKACALDGRRGIGIELNPRFATLARKRIRTEVRDMFAAPEEQTVFEGDVRDILPGIKNETVDFVVTSPPYWAILKKKNDHKVRQERISKGLSTDYGEDPRDLGNIEQYSEFLKTLGEILVATAHKLRRGKYMAIVVSDFREESH